jgi:hypothetical protein
MWCPNDGFTSTHDHIVIPAFAGIQPGKPGFRIKSGMTDTVKLLLRHDTSSQPSGFGPELIADCCWLVYVPASLPGNISAAQLQVKLLIGGLSLFLAVLQALAFRRARQLE